MTQAEMIERHRYINRLGYAHHEAARKRPYAKWTTEKIVERYQHLCDLVPDCPARAAALQQPNRAALPCRRRLYRVGRSPQPGSDRP